MKTEIFITPQIGLSHSEILACIESGADSARIHCGKASLPQIVELMRFYNRINFIFNLDLRGNKANVQVIDRNDGLNELILRVGDEVVFFTNEEALPANATHSVKLSFLPEALNTITSGNLTVDDGRLVFDIIEIVKTGGKVVNIKTIVTQAEQTTLYKSDGVSSTNIFIHSGATEAYTPIDEALLVSIPDYLRYMVKYIAISFCESPTQIVRFAEFIKRIGYQNCQVIPKIETLDGVHAIEGICLQLVKMYGNNAKLHVGSADLSLDALRSGKSDYHPFVDTIVDCCKRHGVNVSVLAMLLQSVRHKLKEDPESTDLTPTEDELRNIRRLLGKGVGELGLTNDMYVQKPERIVRLLRQIIDNYAVKI